MFVPFLVIAATNYDIGSADNSADSQRGCHGDVNKTSNSGLLQSTLPRIHPALQDQYRSHLVDDLAPAFD